MQNLLVRPYIYNTEYIQESEKSKFFRKPEIEWFYPLNNQIFEFYQVLREDNFNIAFWAFFENISKLKTQYILKAIKIIDKIYFKHFNKKKDK